MEPERPGRVIVGVHPTLSGLQALRVAVEQARARGAELHAVRVANPPAPDRQVQPGGGMGEQRLCTEATAMIADAFAETMGGPPPDLEVRMVVMPDSPGSVLSEYACRDADLLVLGGGRRGWRRRPWGSKVVRRCVATAGCPVLVVPPPPLARSGSTRTLVRRLRRDIDQLASDGHDKTSG